MVQVFVSALNDALRDQRPLASSTDRGALMHLELLDTVNQSKRTIAIDRVKRSAYLRTTVATVPQPQYCSARSHTCYGTNRCRRWTGCKKFEQVTSRFAASRSDRMSTRLHADVYSHVYTNVCTHVYSCPHPCPDRCPYTLNHTYHHIGTEALSPVHSASSSRSICQC